MTHIGKLSRRFLIMFIFVACAWIGIQLITYQFILKNVIESNASALGDEILLQMSQRINFELKTQQDLTATIAGNYRIKTALDALNERNSNFYLEKSQIMREVLAVRNIEAADNVYIFIKDSIPINCYYSVVAVSTPYEYETLLADYDDILGDNIHFEVQKKDAGYRIVSYSYIKRSGQVLGLLVVEFKMDMLDSIIQSGKQTEDNVYIIDAADSILYANNKETVSRDVYDYYPEGQLFSRYPLSYGGWAIAGDFSEYIVRSEIQKLRNAIILFAIATLAVILVWPVSLQISFSRHMSKILTGIEHVQKGELNFTIENTAKNEFRLIIDHFNNMIRRIKELLQGVAEQKKLYHQAEIATLQARLSPHFLYNTLDMIHWMLIMEEKEEISDIIVSLADILRYSVSNAEQLTTVKEDMRILTQYLDIQKARFNNRLTYFIFIAEEVEEFRVPRLFMQPLAENSIKYAFKGMSIPGSLCLRGYKEGGDIVFVIEDNGAGMSEKKIAEIYDRLNNKMDGIGLGFQLVYIRITELYPESKITIQSTQGSGTAVEIRIGNCGL